MNEVSVGVTPIKIVNTRGSLQAKRLQYSLKHIAAIPINKSQGEIFQMSIAMELTKKNIHHAKKDR